MGAPSISKQEDNMRELTLKTTRVTLKINGKEYTAKMSDAEIIGMVNEKQRRFGELMNREYTIDEVLEAVKDATDSIDAILGDGAVAAISNGEAVSVRDAIRWLTAIANAVTEEYVTRLVEQYG